MKALGMERGVRERSGKVSGGVREGREGASASVGGEGSGREKVQFRRAWSWRGVQWVRKLN